MKTSRTAALLALLLCLAGCAQEMANQPRYEPLEASTFFEDGLSSRQLPIGTVARGQLWENDHLYRGMQNGELATGFPFPITMDVMLRGQERFNIFCTPCHDRVGTGRGIAALRGFERMPVSFHLDRLKEAPPGYFFHVITYGFGLMNDYAAQIPPEDRWAIIAYIRALQLSQDAGVSNLSPQDLQELERAGQ